jgi:amino acid adenylation domain-containing protein
VREMHAEKYSYDNLQQMTLAQLKEMRQEAARRNNRPRVAPLAQQKRGNTLPLSYAQERLWFLDQLGLVGPAYNMPMPLRLAGALDVAALERSFAELIRRHESLRTRFASAHGSPVQIIDAAGPFGLEVKDLSGLESEDQARQVERLSREDAQRPFDLTRAPLLRACLLKLGPLEHILLLTLHHIVSDGWSLGVLNRELSALYGAFSQGLPSPLPELPVQYADYAIWQREWLRGDILQSQLQYWRERIADAPPQLQLPTDRPRPTVATFKGALLTFELPLSLRDALNELARREGATLFMVILAAYQLLLSRYCGVTDVVVGSGIAGRTHANTEGLIGFFVNMLTLRTDLSGNPTFRDLLKRVKEVTVGAYAHQDLPFEKLVKELRPERNLTRQPLFQVALAYQNYPEEPLQLAGLTWTPMTAEQATSLFDLTLHLFETREGLRGELEYMTDLFDRSTIERVAEHFGCLLRGIVADPDRPIQLFTLLGESERELVLNRFNDTAVAYGEDRLIHQQFEEHAARTPQAEALAYEEQSLTYAQLNSRANQLARHLRERGAGPDQFVALFFERGLEMIVAVLATLKSGAAYVPMDPAYPPERLAHILEETTPRVLVTQRSLSVKLPASAAVRVELDTDSAEIDGQSAGNLGVDSLGLGPEHLAYVIYTSGSTGKPKGVMVSHRNLIASNFARQDFYGAPGRFLLLSPLGFDSSVAGIFGTLTGGGTLLVASQEALWDPEQLLLTLRKQRATSLLCVPALYQKLLSLAGAELRDSSLSEVIVAGEACPPTLVEESRQRAPAAHLFNEYGPTEATVWASVFDCLQPIATASVPIGRPIANTRIYILDDERQPVPIGVVGEIHVGGVGVTRGYLHRPELTQERFVPDPFSRAAGARLYRTGDLGRWRADGVIEYVGRNDHQVKLRGFRIELGEIEAQLLRYPHVKQAVVVAREDGATPASHGEKRLVGYVVADIPGLKALEDSGDSEAGKEIVGQWKTLYEETYSLGDLAPGFVGWNSSFTGEPIPEEHMREWLRVTIERLSAYRPRKVLEIGCGAGLIVEKLAPACETYWATDFSAEAVGKLHRWLSTQPELRHVELSRCSALELTGVAQASYDTVILNSVVQYFPDIDYLFKVLERAVGWVSPGGRIFVGDVRHLGLLSVFQSAVQLQRAGAATTVGELQQRTSRAVAFEKELVIDPRFFEDLPQFIPAITHVKVLLKRGESDSELTRYRYDVVLEVGDGRESQSCQTIHWNDATDSFAGIAQRTIETRPGSWRIRGVPNRRLCRDIATAGLIAGGDKSATAASLLAALEREPIKGEDPEAFWKLGDERGYVVGVSWNAESAGRCFDVELLDPSVASGRDTDRRHEDGSARTPRQWRVDSSAPCANDPWGRRLQEQLIPRLRQYLKETLPPYMVPSAYVVLDSLPLTFNGKLNRSALPEPDGGGVPSQQYEAPRGEVEELLATIWQELLRLERVGRNDNFFELGGHSLLVVQMKERLRRVGLSFDVRSAFESPTLAALASTLIGETSGPLEVPPNLILPGCEAITPQMLPLVELEPQHIELIVRSVPGGAGNIQDIYALTALQEGMLFHHLLNEHAADAYVRTMLLSLSSRERLDEFIHALQQVIDRHDILRTAMLWKELPQPVQVVSRQAKMPVDTLVLQKDQDAVEQLTRIMKIDLDRLDLEQAPLMRLNVAQDPKGDRWYALLRTHHLVCDNEAADILLSEVSAYLEGRGQSLPEPGRYRSHVAQALAQLRTRDPDSFFRGKLADVEEPTAPFGVLDVHGDGSEVETIQEALPSPLATNIRAQARRLGVSAATLFHAAWALVVGHTAGRDDVVFGTVLLGRLQGSAGAQRILGMFINTLPLRLRLSGLTAEDLVNKTQRELLELFGYEQASLSKAQRCSGLTGSAPLFTALLNYRHAAADDETEFGDAAGVELLGSHGGTNYPVLLSVVDQAAGFVLEMETDRRIDPRRMIGYVLTAIHSLVTALESAPQTPALELPILPESERQQVLELFNATEAAYPAQKLIHELFEEQVERSPNAVAVIYEDQSLTYGELNTKANQLAWYLRERHIGPDELVGICVERSLEMVVGLLAILKAGGAYVPLDPSYPSERLQYVLGDAAPKLLLTQARLRERLAFSDAEVIELDEQWNEIAQQPGDDLDATALGLRSHHLAYVIYTSGSTGKPKGVMVEHESVMNFLTSMGRTPGISTLDSLLAVTTVSFDIAALEIYLPLVNGAKLVLASREAASDAQRLIRILEEFDVTVLQATPATWKLLMGAQWSGRSTLKALCGGEALASDLSRKLLSRVGVLWNLYGPTETTIWSCRHEIAVTPPERESLEPIGRPISNTWIYILDSQRQPVPIGVVGEIYIGGAGVARGYLNRPELTAERFIKDPFTTDLQARMYKTGDLGRWRADGNIEYLGRNDSQVKIRGFRIELGEIEAQLLQHPQVGEAVVLAREDEPGDWSRGSGDVPSREKRLVAYLVSRDATETGNALSREILLAHLKPVLPDYMLPSAFVVLESLPLTANGKLDRRALPAPERSAYGSQQYEAPQGEIEEILAGIWQGLLRVARVSRHDHFFELGGHSLLIVQMLERLRRVGLSTEVRRVFESPRLADLASVLSRGALDELIVPPNLILPGCEAITPQMLPLVELEAAHIERIVRAVAGGAPNIQDIYPLAPLQEGILFHHLLDQDSDTYARTTLLSLSSRERLTALIEALQSLIDRHDILRTAVLWEQLPQSVQVVYRRAILPVEEIALDPDRDPIEQLKERMKPQRRQRLDLRQAPLMRLQFSTDPRSHQCYALLQTHHLVCDNESIEILISEVVDYLRWGARALPKPAAYRDHVAQALAYARTHDAESFFRSKLGDVEEPTAPYGLLDVHGDGSQIEEAHQQLELALSQRVRAHARRLGVSAATLFHAAWGLVVARTSGRDDVVYGTVLLGRLQGSAGAQRILGMFINTLPLRLPLREITAKGLVERTQRELVELLSHEQTSLALAQRCSGVVGSMPLFSSLLNYRHSTFNPEGDWSGQVGITSLAGHGETNYPITVSVDDLREGFEVTAETDRRIDPQRMVQYVCTAVQSLVEALERAPQTPALLLSILPEGERQQVLERFNATVTAYPAQKLIHELFEEQVLRTPDALAVVYEGCSLTYTELNARANQLAWYLRDRQIGPDRLVGICVERSLEMVVGVLGILKAGGAYIPLDPTYPSERLAYLLSDALPGLVLIQERLRDRLPGACTEVISIDADWPAIAQAASLNVDARLLGLEPHHLAYVIYTSGSTGKPKGVMIEHRQVVNLAYGLESAYGRSTVCGRVALNASLNFDASVQQLVQLTSGRTLFLVPQEARRDASLMVNFIRENRIEGIDCTPSQLKTWLSSGLLEAMQHRPRRVLVGGEAIDSELWRSLSECSDTDFINVYGPTECTVDATLAYLTHDTSGPHIGRPMQNRCVYILDSLGQPVGIGVTGEIYIGGAGVARGYLNRPELTAERFIKDPFSRDLSAGDSLAGRSVTQGRVRGMPRTGEAVRPDPGQTVSAQRAHSRMYKTGDLGRWRADGTIEYLGRNDHQVKIRGFRIELGEIESQLARHSQVSEAVVIAYEGAPHDGPGGDKRLVAYVVPHPTTPLSVESLRTHLQAVLPEYMVPSAFVILESLPLTSSGKLDRRALPVPEHGAYTSRQYEAPRGEIEEALARIWGELLRVERVGRQDNFFELGGHSLLILKLIARSADQFKMKLPIQAVFRNPTLEGMAQVVDTLQGSRETSLAPVQEEFEEGVL